MTSTKTSQMTAVEGYAPDQDVPSRGADEEVVTAARIKEIVIRDPE